MNSTAIIIFTVLIGVIVVVVVAFDLLSFKKSEEVHPEDDDSEEKNEATSKQQKRRKPKGPKSRNQTSISKKTLVQKGSKDTKKKQKCTSPLLFCEMKGHKSQVTSVAFSPDGRFVATASEDQAILITFRETLGQHGVQPRQWRLNVEFDYASSLRFADNNKRLIAGTASHRNVLFYGIPTDAQVNKGAKPELLKQFETTHTDAISYILLLDVEKWMVIVTCAGDDDTTIRFWNPKGEELDSANTNQIKNNMIAGSPDGRFVGAACYTPDVKLFEVERLASGEFKKVTKAMALQHGHTKAVTGVAFNPSSSRVATCSVDGTWAVWDITVRYNVAEDPRLLLKSSPTLNCPFAAVAFCSFAGSSHVMLSSANTLLIYPERSEETADTICNSHNSSAEEVTHLVSSLDGSFVISICEQDKHARIWGPLN